MVRRNLHGPQYVVQQSWMIRYDVSQYRDRRARHFALPVRKQTHEIRNNVCRDMLHLL